MQNVAKLGQRARELGRARRNHTLDNSLLDRHIGDPIGIAVAYRYILVTSIGVDIVNRYILVMSISVEIVNR